MSGGGLIAIVDNDASALEATVDLMRALGFAEVGLASAAEFLSQGISGSARLDHRHADVRDEWKRTSCTPRRIGHPIPTTLITAYPEDVTRTCALEAGVGDYLAKPLEVPSHSPASRQPGEPARRDLQDE